MLIPGSPRQTLACSWHETGLIVSVNEHSVNSMEEGEGYKGIKSGTLASWHLASIREAVECLEGTRALETDLS